MLRIHLENRLLKQLGNVADQAGREVFLVGGYVRDLLMERATTDIDVAVVGDGIEFATMAAAALGTGKPVIFERFGTARLEIRGTAMEFVGTRKEEYDAESRKPRVVTGTIADDLARRDFTVNALAVSLNAESWGEILDPYRGAADIERKKLRTPLDPATTFSDDPLRMMRAFRFAAQLQFAIDPGALEAIRSMHERIAIVSAERIRDEFLKILAAPRPSIAFAPMQESGLLKHVFPEFHELAGVDQRSVEYPGGSRNFHHKDVFHHTLRVLDTLCESSGDIWLRLAAVLHDIAKPRTKAFKEEIGWTFHGHAEIGARMTRKIFRNLRLPLERLGFVEKMVALHLRPIALVSEGVSDSAIRRLLFEAGNDIDALMMLCKSDITSKNAKLAKRYLQNYDRLIEKMREVEEKDRLRNWQPPLRGEEIMAHCGIGEGVAVGILKNRIEDAILDGLIPNTRDAALAYLESVKDEVLSQPLAKGKHSLKYRLKTLPENLRS